MSEPLLAGVRVVDMTQYLSGPTVTRLMAELGADIVKIEKAPYGDPIRRLPLISNGRSGYFVQQNRGKKSLCIDFDKPEGRAVLDQLIDSADVLVENYGYDSHPELFVFGLLERFDIQSIAALCAPREVRIVAATERHRAELAGLPPWYRLCGKEFDPTNK